MDVKLSVKYSCTGKEILFKKDWQDIKKAFESKFPDVDFGPGGRLCDGEAGAFLDIVITSVSVGIGIVTAEMLKQMGKDIWDAVKKCIVSKENRRIEREDSHEFSFRRIVSDELTLSVKCRDINLCLETKGLSHNNGDYIEKFIKDGTTSLMKIRQNILDENFDLERSVWIFIPIEVEKVIFSLGENGIYLSYTSCNFCTYLESEYLDAPCKTCKGFRGRSGLHVGRPNMKSIGSHGESIFLDDFGNPIPVGHCVRGSDRTDNFDFSYGSSATFKL